MAFSHRGDYWVAGFGGSALMLLAAIFPLFMSLDRQARMVLVQDGKCDDVEDGQNFCGTGKNAEAIVVL